MLDIILTNQFKKDYVLVEKRRKDMSRIKEVMSFIVEQKTLSPQYHNHLLHGDYEGKSECHIQSDWLLIYRVEETSNSVVFYRTGTHSDLF
ncbi:MAG: type II toxin-antitoxin system YafQ family toxin [Treponema sp.]|jgi:mRNA interferase YafQ|nr:type II toxin-antitoxin system YafQ family toxin [Treponema sp.]